MVNLFYIDEELSCKPVVENGEFILYHGTGRVNVKRIKAEGLKAPVYFTRNLGFAKDFGQAVFVIKRLVNYFTGNENDEISFSNDVMPDEFIKIIYHKEKPKYHNMEDFDFPNWWKDHENKRTSS